MKEEKTKKMKVEKNKRYLVYLLGTAIPIVAILSISMYKSPMIHTILMITLILMISLMSMLLSTQKIQNIKCPNCNYTGPGKKYTPGSGAVELILWILFLIPGIIYSIWRVSSRYIGCPKCGYKYVVKEDK